MIVITSSSAQITASPEKFLDDIRAGHILRVSECKIDTEVTMTEHEADCKFYQDVKEAMLNALRNGLSKEQVRLDLLVLARWIKADDEVGAQLSSLCDKLFHHERAA